MTLNLPIRKSEEPKIPEVVGSKDTHPIDPHEILRARSKDLITEDEANRLFRTFVNDNIRPQDLARYLKELCEAENTYYTKDGEKVVTPNWEARKNGYDRALSALRILQGESNSINVNHPTKVIFNVVNTRGTPPG